MTHDQNKKTLRHFQCRDYLWDIFEQMSRELECSTDYLINEAMRQYARSRNYGQRSPSVPGMPRPDEFAGGPSQAPGANPAQAPGQIPSMPRQAAQQPQQPSQPAQPSPFGGASYGAGAPGSNYGQPSQPGYASAPGYAAPPQQNYAGYPPPSAAPPPYTSGAPTNRPAAPSFQPPASQMPPPLPGGGARSPSFNGQQPTLFVIFNGQKIPITKAEFVIGRGSKTADLPIKDGNISRRHAAVVFENGNYFVKDLGSTNGIEFGGQRVDSKAINEGDIFQLCDYELRFTYR